MNGLVKLGETFPFWAQAIDPETAENADADSAPSFDVYKQGSDTVLVTGTMSLKDDANTVGFYEGTIAATVANGFEEAATFVVRISGAVDSVTGSAILTFRVGAEIKTQNRVRLTVIAGQSNAESEGETSELPAELATIEFQHVEIWTGSAFAKLKIGTNQHGTSSTGELSEFGPELQLALDHEKHSNDTLYLVKVSKGSTDLETDWEDGSALRNQLYDDVDDAKVALGIDGDFVFNFVWIQGESDANDLTASGNYETNLTNFLAQVETTIGKANKVIIPRISPWKGRTYTTEVQTAQQNVANLKSHYRLIDTDFLGLESSLIHYTMAGQRDLGRKIANLLYSQDEPPFTNYESIVGSEVANVDEFYAIELEFEVYPDLNSTSNLRGIIGKWKPATNDRSILIRWNQSAGQINVLQSSNGTSNSTNSFSVDFQFNRRHRLRLDRRSGQLICYLDGVQQGNAQNTTVTNVFAGDAEWMVGNYQPDNPVGNFYGKIYSVTVVDDGKTVFAYNSPRTMSRIETLDSDVTVGTNKDKSEYTLATSEHDAIADATELELANDATNQAFLQLIADRIAADWVASDASPVAVASALVANATFVQLISDIATLARTTELDAAFDEIKGAGWSDETLKDIRENGGAGNSTWSEAEKDSVLASLAQTPIRVTHHSAVINGVLELVHGDDYHADESRPITMENAGYPDLTQYDSVKLNIYNLETKQSVTGLDDLVGTVESATKAHFNALASVIANLSAGSQNLRFNLRGYFANSRRHTIERGPVRVLNDYV